jgi:alkanesulfonate monooxygenase SsuD/methylene tetrahydromethanopterin reductase-like flavin-dependent oxidoreductase (luciferase family)
MDGAHFRVHHFARQLASPFPLLAAVEAQPRKIEIVTAVIDMRYENPQYMAEDAGAADLIPAYSLESICRKESCFFHICPAVFV